MWTVFFCIFCLLISSSHSFVGEIVNGIVLLALKHLKYQKIILKILMNGDTFVQKKKKNMLGYTNLPFSRQVCIFKFFYHFPHVLHTEELLSNTHFRPMSQVTAHVRVCKRLLYPIPSNW
jgi:hypothetical protein